MLKSLMYATPRGKSGVERCSFHLGPILLSMHFLSYTCDNLQLLIRVDVTIIVTLPGR